MGGRWLRDERGRFSIRSMGWMGRLIVVWVVLLPATWGLAQMPAAPVVVATVRHLELAGGQTFVGTVVPLRTSTVGSTVEERVTEMLVNEGDRVKQGQPLARLRTRPLEIELASANAELVLRKQELAELENGSRPEEIEQAHARMLAAVALKEYTQSQLKRAETLFERHATSEDDLQDKISAAEAAKQEHQENKAAWELAVAGPRQEQIEQARARVAIAEQETHRLEDDILEHTIVAPFDGYVTKEHTEVGQWIAKGSPVVEVVEVGQVDVLVPVPEGCISRLQPGDTARVQIGALPDTAWTGPVALVVPQADVRSRSFPVKVRLSNRPGPGGVVLKPGMFARVTLPVGRNAKTLVVPKDALILGGSSPTVCVVDRAPKSKDPKEGVVRMVPVELGAAVDNLIEVRGPVKAGQLVVVEGNERLQPGQSVMVVRMVEPDGRPPQRNRRAKPVQ